MSLLASVNSGAPTQPYFIANSGTSSVPEIATPTGTIQIQPNSLGAAYIQAGTSDNTGTVHIGANPVLFDALVVQSIPSNRIRANVPILAGSSLGVVGASFFQQSISLENQQIQNNLRYSIAVPSIADASTAILAQPALLSGSYAIMLQNTANFSLNISCVGIWNGTTWVAGASGTTSGSGGVKAFIVPSNIGDTLTLTNASGSAIEGFLYFTSLGEN